MEAKAQEALDRFNDVYFPGWRERPRADPLLRASTADVQRQCDELRRLVREAVAIIEGGQMRILAWDQDEADDWLRRAHEAGR
jgi:hypothetical protein